MDSVAPRRARQSWVAHPLVVHVEQTGRRGLLSLSGELDLAAAAQLAAAVTGVVANGSVEIEIDGHHVTFVDSAGLHAILAARRAALAVGASFAVCRPSAPMRRVIELAGLAEAFADPTSN